MSAAKDLYYSSAGLEENLTASLSDGVDETLQKMANVECVFEKSFTDKNWTPPPGYSVVLDIQSAPSAAQIRFHFSHAVLAKLYNKIMNETTPPDISQVMDCLREISNVTYGVTKMKVNQDGFVLNMALPLSGNSEDLPKTTGANKTEIPFNIYGQPCYIEVII